MRFCKGEKFRPVNSGAAGRHFPPRAKGAGGAGEQREETEEPCRAWREAVLAVFPLGVQKIPQDLIINSFFFCLTRVLCFYLQLKSTYQHYQ